MRLERTIPVESVPTEPLLHVPAPISIAAPSGYRIPVRRFGIGGDGRPVVMLHGLREPFGVVRAVRPSHRRARAAGPRFRPLRLRRQRRRTPRSDRVSKVCWPRSTRSPITPSAGSRHDSVHILGHCFGAIVALLYAALHRPARVASLVLATPALYTLTDLPPRDKARVLWSVLRRRPARVPVPLSPEEFSELEPFVEFVRDDPLALRTVPARLLYEVRRARRQLTRAADALRAPLLVAMAGDDVICDNPRNRRLLARVTAQKEVREYSGARHILEFSGQREAFLNDLAAWFARREAG